MDQAASLMAQQHVALHVEFRPVSSSSCCGPATSQLPLLQQAAAGCHLCFRAVAAVCMCPHPVVTACAVVLGMHHVIMCALHCLHLQLRTHPVRLPPGGVFVVAHCLAPSHKAETATTRCSLPC